MATVTLEMPAAERISRVGFIISGTIAMSSSYTTGGESITKITQNFKKCQFISIESKGGYIFEADLTNKKIKAFYVDNNAVEDSPMIEVPNATNLSAITGIKWLAFGFR